ncbi:MAG: hypothetical protein JXA77_06850 [Bacteroidales bacterium]|nr:hypothetical protein [Bacteroidales bacterium]MBN2819854.1 hypothetical protein [Bacteroidales bacterium]
MKTSIANLLCLFVIVCFSACNEPEGKNTDNNPADTLTTVNSVDTTTPTNITDTASTGNTDDTPSYKVKLDFPGVSSVGWAAVYVAWIENESGENLQNIYICQKIIEDMTTNTGVLTGIALPYWAREKTGNTDLENVDAVTGASIQDATEFERTLALGDVTKFRVCFEIDRSKNNNDYFTDRPCFIYKSALIDLNNLQESYELTLEAFMPNDTKGSSFGQNPPLQDIPGFEVWKYMTSLQYIEPIDMLLNESVEHSNLFVEISEQ